MAVSEITKDTFQAAIQSTETVLVDFWAPWCQPCLRFAPVFERVSGKFPDVKFIKINTEDQPELAAHFEIRSIPTLMVIKDGDIIFEQAGALPEEALEQIVTKAKEVDMAEVRKANS